MVHCTSIYVILCTCINLMSYLGIVLTKLLFVFYFRDSFFTVLIVVLMTCSISILLHLLNSE
jgi:hypothetical protein